MMAVILAGGRGSRLKPFTITIPKPLLPLGDIPILEVVLRQLKAAGVSRVVLTLGHMAPLFTALIGDGRRTGLQVEYCLEDEPLGTAAPLRLVPGLDDDFLVMNGDLLTTLPYDELLEFHIAHGAWGTISVHPREVRVDYGVVEATTDGRLDAYREKPTISYRVSMGINVLSRRCLEFIPPSGKFDMPELMLAMRQSGKKVMCYETNCYWQDIGRFDDYQSASKDYVENAARFLPAPAVIPLRRAA